MTTSSPTTPVVQARAHRTRARILQAALLTFGRDGYALATTRCIAETAEVSLPAIKYYFESKKGLYLACAHEIVSRYASEVGAFVAEVADKLARGMTPESAREHLKRVMRRVTLVAGDDRDAAARTGFVLREMTEQGPAFDILYRGLWQPGVELTARLIACIEDKPEPDQASHMAALLLHASMTAFSTTQPVSLRYLRDCRGGDSPPATALERALAVLEAQIDRIGAGVNLEP